MNFPKRSHPIHQNDRRAFTVVEMLVVIGIMVLLMSLLTQLGGLGNDQRRVKMAADTIAGAIEQARTYALANNTYTWVALYSNTTTNVVNTVVVASKSGLPDALASSDIILVGPINQSENVALVTPPSNVSDAESAVDYTSLPTGNVTVPYKNTTRAFNNSRLIRFSPLGEAVDNDGYPLNWVGIGVTMKVKGTDKTPEGTASIGIHVNGYTGKTVLKYAEES